MSYSLAQAAKAVDRTKPALLSAIQKGRISAKKNALGQWEIDPAELHRVYPLVKQELSEIERDLTGVENENTAKIRELQARLEALEELKKELQASNEDLREQRDQWRAQADEWRLQAKALPAPKAQDTGTKKGLWWWPPSWLLIA